ncbi:MAG: hypothetical protein JXR10_16225 [Cyclobacteriaceae bacterium]
MIHSIELINQPYSGQYDERIYDNQSPWNSSSWTYVKFTSQDFTEWCGVFRGSAKKVAHSVRHQTILILTSDYLWKLDAVSGNVLEIEDQPQYHNLTVAPDGSFIVADYYNVLRIDSSLKSAKPITSPIQMDMIQFKHWNNNTLTIECDEFTNWENHVELELDTTDWNLRIKKPHNNR